MKLDSSIYALAGIGSYYAFRLKNLGIETLGDLVNHFPFRYDDFSNNSSILETKEGEKVTLQGEIWSIKNIYTKSKKILTQAIFNDGTSPINLTWFNSPYLIKSIQTGDKLQISGKLTKYKGKMSMIAPTWEKISSFEGLSHNGSSLHTGRLVPIYPETEGISSKWFRQKLDLILPKLKDEIEDPLPEEIRENMIDLKTAVEYIHFPQNWEQAEKAKERLGFDELFYIQLATLKSRAEWKEKPLIKPLKVDEEKLAEFINSLPFELTSAQKKVINEIVEDLKKEQPMNRLVQGDVGSGKTIVATVIAYIAHLNGLKSFIMAPTEILAFQHHSTVSNLLNKYGIEVGLYTGSKKFTKNKDFNPQVIVGTHALLSDKLEIDNVGLVIVDEQQRFGVGQRTVLREKAEVPHFLTMTATPIPRTVALTIYGDLDLSVINELPKGRKPIQTHVVPNKKRQDAYDFIAKKVGEGDQVYIITPLIEESETMKSVKAAKVEFDNLQKKIFPSLRLGLLHGKLKPKEKEEVLNNFKDHKIDILVSTSVVEVGVDVTNATIMVIEGAERFGLSQLHQLRGRVGRGEKESYCLLFAGNEDQNSINRLKNLEKTNDGMELAELDLKIRGSGEIFGKRQSGRFELKIASFNDVVLIERTRNAARKLVEKDSSLDNYPHLKAKLKAMGSGVMPD